MTISNFPSITAIAFLIGSPLAANTILFTNLGPSGAPSSVASTSAPFAVRFTAAASGQLDTIRVSAFFDRTSPGPVTAGLFADGAGQPGAVLESWTTVTLPVLLDLSMGITNAPTIASVANPLLTAGAVYWFVVDSPFPDAVHWVGNNTGIPGGYWIETGGTFFPNFDLQAQGGIELGGLGGTSVPEPGTMLVGLGLLGAIALHCRDTSAYGTTTASSGNT